MYKAPANIPAISRNLLLAEMPTFSWTLAKSQLNKLNIILFNFLSLLAWIQQNCTGWSCIPLTVSPRYYETYDEVIYRAALERALFFVLRPERDPGLLTAHSAL